MKIIDRARTLGQRIHIASRVLRGEPLAKITHPSDLLAEMDRSMISGTGAQVSPETAMRVSAVRACVDVIAENLSSLPMVLYRKTNGDDRERATDHPLYKVLRRQPTRTHTKMDWYSLMLSHTLLRGNSYAMKSMVRGKLEELVPIHPSRVYPETKAGEPIYYVTPENGGAPREFSLARIFHFRGPTSDGLIGRSAISDGREAIGLALAQEAHGAGCYRHGATKRGVLVHPGKFSDEGVTKRLREQMAEVYGSPNNLGKWIVTEEGMKPEVFSMTAEDLQYLESRRFQIADIARLFRVPLALIQETEKSTTWGSGVEQLVLGFVTFTLRPWGTRLEEALHQQLLDSDEEYFPEFLYDGLLRGDPVKRAQAHALARQWGWTNVNEIRRKENMNGIGPAGDRYLEPTNMTEAGKTDPEKPARQAQEETEEEDAS